jgi:hypothetical protein
MILHYNPWNFDAEPRDIMVKPDGRAYRLRVSNGRNKRDAGELTPSEIKKPGKIAKIIDGKLVWICAQDNPEAKRNST